LREIMGNHEGGKAIIERCITDEKLLKEDVLHDVPDEHRPSDKDMAEKLKVRHQFRARFSSKVQRKLKRSVAGRAQQPGDEIWMHFKTPDNEVAKFVEKERATRRTGEKQTQEEPEQASSHSIEVDEPPSHAKAGSWLGQPPPLRPT
jgi:platelet-activating factor acetylhydrolase